LIKAFQIVGASLKIIKSESFLRHDDAWFSFNR